MVLEGNSHSVVIPRYDHEAVQGLNEEFLNQHDNIASDKEVADSVTDYINQTIEYGNPAEALNFNPYTGEPIDDTLSLESSFLTEKGRCKEQAAVAYILMELNGVDSAYVKGGYPKWDDGEEEYIHGKHAWLKVDTDQGNFLRIQLMVISSLTTNLQNIIEV